MINLIFGSNPNAVISGDLKLALSPHDDYDSTKIKVSDIDIQSNENLILDLSNVGLLFENFFNGTLKIIGNTMYFIDDITYPDFSFYESLQQTNELLNLLTDIEFGKAVEPPSEKQIRICSSGINGKR
jgi:hypothetical protein